MERRKQFKEFLKREGVWDIFVQNRPDFLKHPSWFDQFVEDNSPEDLIIAAFLWPEDMEGLQYWSNLHDKWTRGLKCLN